jgi:hypothetical protein
VEVLSPEGDTRLALALLDIYSHALITPELAASARAGLDNQPASAGEAMTPQRSAQ